MSKLKNICEIKNSSQTRILQIIPSAYQGSGVLQVVLNWHRHIDTTKVQFDYLFSKPTKNSARAEIESLGGHIFELPHADRHPIQFLKETFWFFKHHRYHTIHSHMTNLNLFFYPIAKLFGTKNIIQHAHLTKWSDKKLNGLRNYLMLHAVWPLITHKMACSQEAGQSYFGRKFVVINNGIDIEKFSFNQEIRRTKRKELGLEDNFVIGHVGRFNLQKNHMFLINIFEQIAKQKNNSCLILVGSGPLEAKIKAIVSAKNLQDKVLFLGVRKDISELYQAFDCFVFPSLHEGLGIVAIEAQAAGLPCVLADTLPLEAFVCNWKKLPLSSVEKWVQEILSFAKDFQRLDTYSAIERAGFCAQNIAKQMQDFYLELER